MRGGGKTHVLHNNLNCMKIIFKSSSCTKIKSLTFIFKYCRIDTESVNKQNKLF